MTKEIKKIDLIKNMAVFKDFHWASSIRDKGNNIVEFKKINILYGCNYSGKTTLSRIFRALETGSISDKYSAPEFQLSFSDGSVIKQNTLKEHGQVIRVFNEDFIKENLRFIVNDEDTINSFAILGENNTKLEEDIKQHETELGNEENNCGLIGEMLVTKKKFIQAKKNYDGKVSDLEDKLRNKANNAKTGIKHNKHFGDANYNVTKIKTDIVEVNSEGYNQINKDQVNRYIELLKEEKKNEINESTPFDLYYSKIITMAKDLIEKKIQTSEPIQELLNDAVLENWVRTGREQHEGKRTKCAFCGNNLPENLWNKLDKHFNKESEELRTAINKLLNSIEIEKKRIPDLFKIKKSDFYSSFDSELKKLEDQFSIQSKEYINSLESIEQQLIDRKNDIFTSITFIESTFVEQNLNTIRDSYEKLRIKSNEYTNSLNSEQSKARTALRLHEVFTFITDIKYNDEFETIINLEKKMKDAEATKHLEQSKVKEKEKLINALKTQLKDESKGAERVNYYLNNFFGHRSISLKAIEDKRNESSKSYRFEVIRDKEKAYHLSEGERRLISFCYFMAKLGDINTKGSQPILWIDDPVCSLDANHIFFVYSLINTELVSPEKYNENGEIKKRERFGQLFISTHNLEFLQYLKKMPEAKNKKKSQFFIINRTDQISHLALMPKYMKEYVTEFNYLFEQIYKCASINNENDQNHTTFFNFGNNARKFLEIYLYYKYPNQGMNEETLCQFFGEERVAAVLTDRINNEYSHLKGILERGSIPTIVPEMKIVAESILKIIKEKDPEQYSALLKSIGENDKQPN